MADTQKQSLALVSNAARALAEAKTLPEMNNVRATVEAAIQWAKQRKIGDEAIFDAQVIVRTAERRMGKILAKMEKQSGGRPKKTGNTVLPVSTLEDIGVSKMQSSRWQTEAKLPEREFRIK